MNHITALLILIGVGACAPLMANDWVLAKEKDGVTVYTRESERSSVKEFKALVLIEASITQLLNTITNFDSYDEWYDHCKQARMLKKFDNGSIVYHLEVGMPFPLSNRDIVCEMTIKNIAQDVEIVIYKKDGFLAEQEDVVRMPVAEGSWLLTKVNEKQTKVIHQFKGDPAGNIPTSIVNMFLVSGPISTLTQLQRYIKK